MGQHHRLSPLQVGVAREDDICVCLRLREERGHEPDNVGLVTRHRVPQIKLQVQRHLVVPAAPGVDLAADRSHQLDEPPLDGHMDVLVLQRPRECAPFDLPADSRQPAEDRIPLLGGEHVDGPQHANVRLRPLDVEGGKHVVERDGSVQPLEQRVLARLEAAAPGLVGAAALRRGGTDVPAPGRPSAGVQICPWCLRAQTSTGRPHSWMKPLADSWLKVSPAPYVASLVT